jgi:hypothetical protein
MENITLKLNAGIYNLGREIEIYKWLAFTAPAYGSKPFNKRLETWLNKASAERFGTHTLEDWGLNHESKIFENVRFSLRKKDYGDGYELNFYYEGRALQWDYETRTSTLRKSNEKECLYTVESINEITTWAEKIAINRTAEQVKARGNIRALARLTKQRDALKAKISEHNDAISYIVADDLRVK